MTEPTLSRVNKDELLAAINRNIAYIVQDVLYPEFLKELKHQGVVEIFVDAVYSCGKQDTYAISAALRGFEMEPWDLTRICAATNLCEQLLDSNESWQSESMELLGGQKSSVSLTSRLCAEHQRDLYYRLVISINLHRQDEPTTASDP